ncbi:uncharacterized protein [Diabrotica undecimpunctata]|uniref:uncharacterized protein n=1 Tax=Diabrotica undecimpunctata TaxID=50387 RepID=UPI003B638A12
MLSSMHHYKSVDQESRKPDIIAFYNSSKGNVDGIDKKCALYLSVRRCQRWPLVTWYSIMDIAKEKSHLIFHAANPAVRKNRSDLIQDLGISLINKHLEIAMD